MGEQALGVFLFSDVVGSTRLWADHEPSMRADLAVHDDLVRGAAATGGGEEFANPGDSFGFVFEDADAAVAAALSMQQALAGQRWQVPGGVWVRIGAHVGKAQRRAGNFYGPVLNETARIAAVGHGGQIVVSEVVAGLLTSGIGVRDLGEHRLRDLDGRWRLFQVDVAGFDNDHPPLRGLRADRSTLPSRRTALIGRERLVGELRTATRQHQLVTLLGPGGAGKTHAAVEAAGRALGEFPDGVFFVDLTRADSHDDVPGAFIEGLGVSASSHRDVVGHLAAQLRDRRALVVVDSCEHVIDAVADVLDRLLDTVPDLHLLTTSRESLDVEGEHVLVIPPLEADSAAAPGVRLFVERALAVDADFDPDPSTLDVIATMAGRLDGMPLAIELAASRIQSMSPAQILEHLDDRFRLLGSSRSRRRSRRQQSLEATIDWSYDLLDADEQRTFRLLSTATGALTLETTARLLEVDEVDAAGRVQALMAKSLLVPVDVEDRRGHRMLETIRQYGEQKLAQGDELASAQLALAEALAPPAGERSDWIAITNQLPEWSPRYVMEAATRRHAAGRALAGGRPDLAALLFTSGTAPDEPGALERARAEVLRLQARDDLGDMTRWLARLAMVYADSFTGRGASALVNCERALAELPPGDSRRPAFQAWRLCMLGLFAPTSALVEALDEALPEIRRHAQRPHDFPLPFALIAQAIRLYLVGDHGRALAAMAEAVEVSLRYSPTRALSLAGLLFIAWRSGASLTAAQRDQVSVLRERDLNVQNLVGVWDAVTSQAPLAARARRMTEVARRHPIGRLVNEESIFLVGFAHLAIEAGDPARAASLLDATVFPDTTTGMAYYDARARLEGWGDDFEARFTAEVASFFGDHEANAARRARMPALLEAEIARWAAIEPSSSMPSTPAAGPPPAPLVDHRVGILGPLQVVLDGVVLDITASKQRAIVATIGLHHPHPVSVTTLMDALWGSQPPTSASRSLQSQVARLRKTLGDGVLVGNPTAGYRLNLPPEVTDLQRMRTLRDSAAAEDRVTGLQEAVRLWRGAPLPDVADDAELRAVLASLEEERAGLEDALAEALVAAGDAEAAVTELERLVREQPLRERRWALLIDALVAANRTADALRAFQRARGKLVEELGVEPGSLLREAEARALAGPRS